ncbi:hypothetical protein [Paenibacillus sp. NPDC058174]|uniref:hypothetical protein n=1 Tax=Paenibacillus sp. NPDC058174 TaxID=3346366 RepID=UPI0036DF6D91
MVTEPRASAIIYNILKGYTSNNTFLMPSNICPIVPITFFKAGKSFEFIDISNDTLCMDEEIIIQKLKRNPKNYAGVFFVRTFGVEESFEYLFKQIKEINDDFIIIDDRCLSTPSFQYVETQADVVLYSTGYSKVVDIGFGGFAQIKNNIKYDKSPLTYSEKSYGDIINSYKKSIESNSKYIYEDCDWLDNSNLNISYECYSSLIEKEFAASIHIKNEMNKIYSENLPKQIQLDSKFQSWRFNIRLSNRDSIINELFKHNLFASTHYASLKGIFSKGKAPNAERLHSSIINLFNDKYYNEEKAYRTVDIINRIITN